jgi:hypothetical protein
MENVLDVYKRPFDPDNPVVCMDESPKQLIGETRVPIEMGKGKEKRIDYEYRRNGVCNIFMANEPLAGKRYVDIRERKTKRDWAEIELNVLNGQCLNRRIDNLEEVQREVSAWQAHRNNLDADINWRFETKDARIKLKRLYPSIHT